MMSRRTLFWFLKLGAGLALVGLLIAKADFRALLEQLRTVDLRWLAVMFALPHIGLWLSTVKWHALLKCHGAQVGIWPLIKLYLIGSFFNSFLPSMIGGDIVRVHQLRRMESRIELAIASTFLERFIGFGALMSLLPLVWLYPIVTTAAPSVTLACVAAILVYAAFAVLLFSPIKVLPSRAPNNVLLRRIFETIAKSQRQVHAYRDQVPVLLWSYFLSLVFYLLAGLTVWAAVKAVNADAGVGFLISVTPLVLLAASIPLSVNGLGVLESGNVLLLSLVSVPLPEAVAVGVLLRVRILFTAALGGLIFSIARESHDGTAAGDRKDWSKDSMSA